MFSSPLSHARVSHTCTASVKPSLLRPTHRAKRNDPHRRTTIAISPVTGTAPIDVDHDRDRADRDRADQRRSRSSKSARLRSRSRRSTLRAIAIAISSIEIAPITIAISPIEIAPIVSRSRRSRSRRSRSLRSRSHRENMLSFWVFFEFLGMNDIMCLFGS